MEEGFKGLPADSDLKGFIAGCLKEKGRRAERIILRPIASDGSLRRFFRVLVPERESLGVAMENPPVDDAAERENRAYLRIGTHLRERGIPVPEIYGADLVKGWFVMEDLGTESLQDRIRAGAEPSALYEPVLEVLLRLQMDGARGFDTEWCCQTRGYDLEVMRRYESDYFRSAFLKGYLGMNEDLGFLDTSFDYLAERASRAGRGLFMHRDFQSRNIVINEGKIGIVDWQGGRMGPAGYDLASILNDPYTALDEGTRGRLYESYRLRLERQSPLLASGLGISFPYIALQRNLQILGAFGFLTKVRKKTYFEGYIPAALKSLRRLLSEMPDRELNKLRYVVEGLSPECRPGR